jgi:hypothetical protein
VKIKVYVIDLEIPPAVKRLWIRVGGPLVLLLAFASVVDAAPPHTFMPNDILHATDLMTDFNNLDSRVTALEARLSGNGQYNLDATYCGATAGTSGNVGGYAGASALCQAACGNKLTAHVCTAPELVRSVVLGASSIPEGRYASGLVSFLASDNPMLPYHVDDCSAFTSSAPTDTGLYYLAPTYDEGYCDTSFPILCCN